MSKHRRRRPAKNRLINHPVATPLIAAATLGALVAVPALAATPHPTVSTHQPAAQDTHHDVVEPAARITDTAWHPPVVPTIGDLEPLGTYGYQQHIPLDPAQWQNAKQIVQVVNDRGMPLYAAVVSLATALQESALRNLTVAVDHDSLGLFQQRPSCGWGSPSEVTDPVYATGAFLNHLLLAVPDWMHTPLWQAAQATQQSAFPVRYAQWQDQAAQIVQAIVSGAAPR